MIFFHHIPKTAGTTINDAVYALNPETTLIVGREGPAALEGEDLSRLLFIGGHLPIHTIRHRVPSGSLHIATLRDPLLRIVSHFEMAYRDDAVFREEICSMDKWGIGFDTFYRRFIVEAKLTNLACAYFSPLPFFYDAVVSIREHFSLVADVSRLDEFQRGFQRLAAAHTEMCVPTEFPQKNRSASGEFDISRISESTLERIRADNQEDFLLHDWLIKQHSGIYTVL